jgi:PAS domain S-box-containing protein
MVDAAAVAVLHADSAGRCLYTNGAWQRLTGLAPRQSAGHGWVSALLPEDREEIHQEWLSAAREGRPFLREFRLSGPVGEVRLVRAHAVPLPGRNGTLPGRVGAFEEITDLKRTEAALRESEERFRQLVDRAGDVIYRTDGKGHYTFMGASVASTLGYTPQEMDGWFYLDVVVPEHRDEVRMFYMWQYTERVPVTYFEFPVLSKDRRLIWIGQKTRLVQEEDGQVAWEAVARDITELKRAEQALRESEERFRLALDHAPIGVALVGNDGRWLKVNGALCEILGYTEEELLARTFHEITYPDDREAVLAQARGLLAGEFRSFQIEKRYLHKQGRVVWVLASGSLVRDPLGQPLYSIAQLQDITERKRLEQEREDLVTSLTEALRNVKTLSGLLPICASCKKIRDDQGYWNQIEVYVRQHSQADFSHGICPDCLVKLYPELTREREPK